MFDFTTKVYKKLLDILFEKDYTFQTFINFLQNPNKKAIILLRHDVDKNLANALTFAHLEKKMSVTATYYFRIITKSINVDIIKKISALGHEIGYHYEDISSAYSKLKNKRAKFSEKEFNEVLFINAIESFKKNLNKLREISPVKTICMHGSPLSTMDNRDLWKKNNYKDFGIIGDPYFDLDFNDILYLSDTGRRWDGCDVSVRDKVETKYNYKFRSTFDIINKIDTLPDKIMLNIHPQRWNDKCIPWLYEYIFQNTKNIFKKYFLVMPKQNL